MRSSTAKQTEKAAYDQVREAPFTRIPGRPTRLNRNTLRSEMCGTASDVDMPYDYAGEYGLLGDVLNGAEYTALTGLVWIDPEEPEAYDPDIDDTMDDHERKRREANWTEVQQAWWTRKGALRGLCQNYRDAVDKKYHSSLSKPVILYKKVTIKQYFAHLDKKWCKLDTEVIQEMKAHYLRGWEHVEEEEIDTFIKRLNDEQEGLGLDGITISDTDKLQHFLEQMNGSGLFDRRDYQAWEDQLPGEKTWPDACDYYTSLVDSMDSYNKNQGGTAKKSKYESAAHIKQEQQEQEDESALQVFMQAQANKDEIVQAVTSNQNTMSVVQSDMQKMLAALAEQLKTTNAQMVEQAKTSNAQIAALQAQIQTNNKSGGGGGKRNGGGSGGGNGGGDSDRGKENINNGRAKTGEAPCKHCGGQHHNYKGGRDEDKCGGKDWPNNANDGTPQWFIEKMNKKTGKDYKNK